MRLCGLRVYTHTRTINLMGNKGANIFSFSKVSGSLHNSENHAVAFTWINLSFDQIFYLFFHQE